MTNIQNLLTFIADNCAVRPGYHADRPVFIITLPGDKALVAEWTMEGNETYEEGEYEMLTPHGDVVTLDEAEQIVERLAWGVVNTLHENGTYPLTDGWDSHLTMIHLNALQGEIECPECHRHSTITMNHYGDLSCTCGWSNASTPLASRPWGWQEGDEVTYRRPYDWSEERFTQWCEANQATPAE